MPRHRRRHCLLPLQQQRPLQSLARHPASRSLPHHLHQRRLQLLLTPLLPQQPPLQLTPAC
jgi:hypothetical protein